MRVIGVASAFTFSTERLGHIVPFYFPVLKTGGNTLQSSIQASISGENSV